MKFKQHVFTNTILKKVLKGKLQLRDVNHTMKTNKLKKENQKRGSMSGVGTHMHAHTLLPYNKCYKSNGPKIYL